MNSTLQNRPVWLRFSPLVATVCLVGLGLGAQSSATARDTSEVFLWRAPESGRFLLAPLAGWSTAGDMDGPCIGMRAMFPFKHFVAGIHGQAIFVESGAVYVFGVDTHLRYGPLYGGVGFTGHFFPGNTSRPTPVLNFQVGVHIPLPLNGVFAEVAYRPNIIFHRGRQVTYHTFLLGFVFETGT